MLTGTVHAGKRLLVQHAAQTVFTCYTLQSLHYQLVMIYCHIGRLINRCHLMLCGCCFVVLCLGSHAQLPQFDIHIVHETADAFTDNAEVMVIHLLALGRRSTKQGPSGKNNIFTLQCLGRIHQEIFLLCADGGQYLGCLCITEQTHNTDCLFAQSFHGAKQRGFFIQCFTLIRTKCSRDAKGRTGRGLLNECRRCDIPCGISSCLKSRTQSAGRERRSIRLSLDQFLAGKFHDHTAILIGMCYKSVMFLRGNAGQRLEPVGIMSRPVLNCPVFHGRRHYICCRRGKFSSLIHNLFYFFVSALWESLLHLAQGKYLAGKKLLYIQFLAHVPTSLRYTIELLSNIVYNTCVMMVNIYLLNTFTT